MKLMTQTMMQTYTGKLVDLADFTEEDVRLPDISHALSLLNRFTGHSKSPYSVAQHSVLVSRLVPERYAMWGLLHDASETYLGDVATPLKAILADYRELEGHVQRVIARKFGLVWPMPPEVKDADLQALLAEKRDLLTADHDWGIGATPTKIPVQPCGWQEAKKLFEWRFKEIAGC